MCTSCAASEPGGGGFVFVPCIRRRVFFVHVCVYSCFSFSYRFGAKLCRDGKAEEEWEGEERREVLRLER